VKLELEAWHAGGSPTSAAAFTKEVMKVRQLQSAPYSAPTFQCVASNEDAGRRSQMQSFGQGKATSATIVTPDEARVYQMGGGGEARLLLTGEETGGAWWMGRFREDPGFMTTFHVHSRTDEQIYILEGILSVYVSGAWHELTPGTFAVLPHGVPHAQGNRTDKPVHFIGSGSPSAFERLFPAVDALLKRGVKPGSAEFLSEFQQISMQCDIENLGPAPQ
jgi:quercetin dioxygenase-like cupin family protein